MCDSDSCSSMPELLEEDAAVPCVVVAHYSPPCESEDVGITEKSETDGRIVTYDIISCPRHIDAVDAVVAPVTKRLKVIVFNTLNNLMVSINDKKALPVRTILTIDNIDTVGSDVYISSDNTLFNLTIENCTMSMVIALIDKLMVLFEESEAESDEDEDKSEDKSEEESDTSSFSEEEPNISLWKRIGFNFKL